MAADERLPVERDEADAGDGDDEAALDEGGGDQGPSRVALGDGSRRGHLAIVDFDERGRPRVIEHSFVVENECHGWRLDRFLMKRIRRLSRARIQRVIRGDLEVNGVRVDKPGAVVRAADVVRFRRPAPVEPEVPRTVEVLAGDDAYYALDKPAGLPIHPTARYHYSTLTAVLRERFPDERLEVCHRLDRETSGVLLVARTREAGPLLKRAFARRRVAKTYLAIVHGELDGERRIDLPLALAGSRVRLKMAVRPVDEGGLPSRTVVLPRRRFRGYTLVEARPETGRQHQIRAHLDAIGLPIVGDKLYPDEERFIEWAEQGLSEALLDELRLPRHALHAATLEFPHPLRDERVRVESPLPEDLRAFLSTLGPALD
jgi:23S rRNA pseudouridine1911/1915/1917 synthase